MEPADEHARLYAVTGAALVALGAALFALLPAGLYAGVEVAGAGPLGAYMGAFAGCCAAAWGMALFAARRQRDLQRALAAPSATGFALAAVMRLVAIPGRGALLPELDAGISGAALAAEILIFVAAARGFAAAR